MKPATMSGIGAPARAGEVIDRDAKGQAAALRSADIKPRELIQAAAERIGAADAGCGAISWLRVEEALSEADQIDPTDADAPPFAGVPILLKDHRCQAAGQETRFGTSSLAAEPHPWPVDTNVYRSLVDQGFVVVGRTTTPEFATALLTESVATGVTRNPLLPTHASGGSSGGSAAAVAAGMVAVAHATDGGGSIRVPAACVGIVGLKPSRGRVSMGPDSGESWAGATVEGVLTRTVGDAAAVTAGMSRWFPGDPYVAPGTVPPAPGSLPSGLRVGVMSTAPDDTPWHPDVTRVLREVADTLAERGHRVDDSRPAALSEADEFSQHYDLMISVDVELLARKVEGQLGRSLRADELAPRNAVRRRQARRTGAAAYLDARYWLNGWAQRLQSWWYGGDARGSAGDWDLLLLPTLGGLPPLAASDAELADAATLDASIDERSADMRPMTNFFNVGGLPAISLPLGATDDGIPIGIQAVARFGEESTLLALGADFEARGPWRVARTSGHDYQV